MKAPEGYLPPVETFEMKQYVSGALPIDFADWPRNMQDQVMISLENLNAERAFEGKPRLAIARTHCERDGYGRWYVTVIAQTALYVEAPLLAPETCPHCGLAHKPGAACPVRPQ